MKKQSAGKGTRRSVIRLMCHVMAAVILLAVIPVITSQRAEAAPVESSDFLMYIENARNLPGRGTILLGRISKGTVHTGDSVILAGSTSTGDPTNYGTEIKGLTKAFTEVDTAKAGDAVNVLVDIPVSSVKVGDALISDNNSPYVNHRGLISGSLTSVNGGCSLEENESVTLRNDKVTLTVEAINEFVIYPTIDSQNVEVYFKNPDRAHVYRIGDIFDVIVNDKIVGKYTVKKVASSGAHTIVANEYDRIQRGAAPVDLSGFSDPYPNYAWIPSIIDGVVCARSGNSGRRNTDSMLTYKTNLSETTTIRFRYMTKSEGSGDKCKFIVDGTEYFSYTANSFLWATYELALSPGSHTLSWEYMKDGTEREQDDFFAVSDLCFYEPMGFVLDANGGYFPSGGTQITGQLQYKKEISLSSFSMPVRKGYVFRGYNESPDYKGLRISVVEWPYSPANAEMTYYAVWEKVDYNLFRDLDFAIESDWESIDRNADSMNWEYFGEQSDTFTKRMSHRAADLYSEHYEEIVDDDWLVSPAVKLGDMKYSLKFMAKNTKMLSVYVGTSSDVSKMKKIADYHDNDVHTLTDFSVPLDGYENKKIYIAFRYFFPKHNEYGDLNSSAGTTGIEHVRILTEFSDVRTGSDKGSDPYYYEPVYWAQKKGVTGGVKDKDGVARSFNPQGVCNRAQMVAFLWRMAGCPEPTKFTSYKDVKKTDYFYKAVSWAQEKGITGGYTDGTFRPTNPCTRAQAVTFLYRLADQPKVSGGSSFKDVKPGTYYCNAVIWASQNGITGGYSDGTFKPDGQCTRAQMVTFLYRYEFNVPKG